MPFDDGKESGCIFYTRQYPRVDDDFRELGDRKSLLISKHGRKSSLTRWATRLKRLGAHTGSYFFLNIFLQGAKASKRNKRGNDYKVKKQSLQLIYIFNISNHKQIWVSKGI